MKKFRNVPAIITLLAGFAACVVMIINEYSILSFMWILLGIMAGFYILGLLARFVLNKAFEEPKKTDENSENSESDENSQETDGTNEKEDTKDTETVTEK